MQIRFLQSTAVPGGPLYHPGEAPITDPWLLTEERARTYVQRGWAEEVTVASPTAPPRDKALDRPARDKMLERAPAKKG